MLPLPCGNSNNVRWVGGTSPPQTPPPARRASPIVLRPLLHRSPQTQNQVSAYVSKTLTTSPWPLALLLRAHSCSPTHPAHARLQTKLQTAYTIASETTVLDNPFDSTQRS